MKNKKIHLLPLFLMFICLQAYTQHTGIFWNILNESSNRLQGKISGEVYSISSLSNTYHFLQKDWTTGSVVLTDGDVFEDMKMRYLARGDELIAYNDNLRTLYKIDKEIVSKFYFKDNTGVRGFVKLHFDGINEGDRYFEELYSGDTKLLAFHHVVEVRVSPYADKQGILRDSEFKMSVNYYMNSSENGFKRLQTKRRSFIKTIPQHKKEIRNLFRQNKIVLSKEKSMIQAFELLDNENLLN